MKVGKQAYPLKDRPPQKAKSPPGRWTQRPGVEPRAQLLLSSPISIVRLLLWVQLKEENWSGKSLHMETRGLNIKHSPLTEHESCVVSLSVLPEGVTTAKDNEKALYFSTSV